VPSKTRSRVLCLDDDKDACEMLSVLMDSYGIEATCVQSAAEAWLKIKKERFDLYLLDVWLPRHDGFEFCRQLRELDSNTPVVFYSGAGYDTDKEKGIAAGANVYVIKPDVEGLIATVVDLIATAKTDNVAARWARSHLASAESSPPHFFSVETVLD